MAPDAGDAAADLERRVTDFLSRNFPQIRMHGGNASVEAIDPETGEITIRLGGACSGCGISPMTVRAITSRLPDAIPEIETVHAETGGPDAEEEGAGAPIVSGLGDGEDADAPF
ncbi:MAG: NifU family protein [Haloferacaceae archaeon]